jgi:hypothetical protein
MATTTIDQKTTNRLYPKPFLTNSTAFDVGRLRASLDAIDADVASLLLSFAAKANLADPVFTGNPTAPTKASNDSSASIATTAFVQAVLAAFDTTGYATVNSPIFTGNPQAPTPSIGDNSASLATTSFVAAKIAALVGGAPATLDTLNEIATALGSDPNLATTLLTRISDIETQRNDWVEGLIPANNAGTPLLYVDISTGRCRFGSKYVANGGVLTKRLNTAWSAGNNGGFLDTGSMAAVKTYHIWVLRNIATPATIDFIASLQNTSGAVTVPAGWEILPNGRIGSVLTNSLNQINAFTQTGNRVKYITYINEFTSTTFDNNAYNPAGMPDGISVDGDFLVDLSVGNNTSQQFLADTDKGLGALGPLALHINIVYSTNLRVGGVVRTRPDGTMWCKCQNFAGSVGTVTLFAIAYRDYTVPRKGG